MEVLASDYCKGETLQSLKYTYTLPEFLNYKEYIDVMESYKLAITRDAEAEAKRSQQQ